MPNMNALISQHNKSILNQQSPIDYGCNCRVKCDCPLDGKCKTDNVIYQATVTTNDNEIDYIGSTSTTFKARYNDHMCSTRHLKYKAKSELSTYIWELKENKIDFNVKWKILDRALPYKNGLKKCNLCLREKLLILNYPKAILNNKELTIKCRHRFKFKMKYLV